MVYFPRTIVDNMIGIDMIVRRVKNFDKSIYRVHNSKFQLIQIIVHRSQAYYRPNVNDKSFTANWRASLNEIQAERQRAFELAVGGDFNLPGLD